MGEEERLKDRQRGRGKHGQRERSERHGQSFPMKSKWGLDAKTKCKCGVCKMSCAIYSVYVYENLNFIQQP